MTTKKSSKNLKSRTGTASNNVNLVAAGFDIEPPVFVELHKDDRPFWDVIIRGKAKQSWTDQDLVHAANLAYLYGAIKKLKADLRNEGEVVDTGSKIEKNPKVDILSKYVSQTVQMSRLLQIHPIATVGRAGDQPARNQKAREAATVFDDDAIDRLLAEPGGLLQ